MSKNRFLSCVSKVLLFLLAFTTAALGLVSNVYATETYNVYFGDLHNHTSYSDGTGTPSQAFSYVKNNNLGDFMAITDHSILVSSSEWSDTRTQADAYTDSSFVGIAGWEFSGLFGHMNVYNTTWITGNPFYSMTGFYDQITSHTGSLASWNHPTDYSNEFNNFSDYTTARDAANKLIEVVNTGTVYESSFQKALSKGWHVSPSATSDHHSSNWMSVTENRIAVLAPSLTRTNIFDAINNGRVYATQDKNLKVNFTVNGSIMGSVLSGDTSFNISVHAEDPDTSDVNDIITNVEIITDGGTVAASAAYSSYNVDFNTTLTSSTSKYYYARITNAEGKKAYTTPVWTGR